MTARARSITTSLRTLPQPQGPLRPLLWLTPPLLPLPLLPLSLQLRDPSLALPPLRVVHLLLTLVDVLVPFRRKECKMIRWHLPSCRLKRRSLRALRSRPPCRWHRCLSRHAPRTTCVV